MKKIISAVGSIALFCLLTSTSRGADALKPDADGYIRDWVMLAPIALPEGATASELIAQEQVKGEAAFKPKAGDKIKVGDKELIWKNISAPTNYFDFNEILKTQNDAVAGYMVTYIESDKEMADVTMSAASNDQGRYYLNGKEVYTHTESRTLEIDSDKKSVTLSKGVNVVVVKVINEQNNWQGALRFLDKAGAPVKDLKVKLSP